MHVGFVGRQNELALLLGAFERAKTGRGQLVLLSGEPGIGKTRLAEEALERCQGQPVAIARGRCWDFGGAPPLWPWVEVLRALTAGLSGEELEEAAQDGRHVSHLLALCPELARRFSNSPVPDGGDEVSWSRLERFEAVARVLEARATSLPQLVLLDDLHAADVLTLELLLYVVRRLKASAILLVGTARSVGYRSTPQTQAALAELRGQASLLPLAGLDQPALEAWLASNSSAPVATELIDSLWERTHGNPLFVRGMVATALERGGLASLGQAALPADVLVSVQARLSLLSPGTQEVLGAAAVLGRPFHQSFLERVTGERTESALLEAKTSGILELAGAQWRFAHDLFREALFESLPIDARRRFHARIADVLEAQAAAPAELARHHRNAGPSHVPQALTALRRAGAVALAETAWDEAADHALAARELAADAGHDDLSGLISDEAEARLAAGQPARARVLFVEAATLARARGREAELAVAALGVARTGEYGSTDRERAMWLDTAKLVADRLEPRLRARVLARHAMEGWSVVADPAALRGAIDVALELARASGDDESLAFVLSAALQATGAPADGHRRAELTAELVGIAARHPGLDVQLEALRWKLNVHTEAGEVALARLDIEAYRRLAETSRRPQVMANALLREGLLTSIDGDFDAAERNAVATRDAALRAGDPQADVIFVSRTCLDLLESGRGAEVHAWVAPLREHVRRLPHFPMYRAILVRALLASGQRSDAMAEWETTHARELHDLPQNFATLSTLCLLAPSAVQLGDRARAERLVQLLAPHQGAHASIGASRSLGPVGLYLAGLARFLGTRADAETYLASALTLTRKMGASWWTERVTLVAAELGVALAIEPAVRRGSISFTDARWRLEFEGVEATVPHARGLDLIARLIVNADTEVSALDLVNDGRVSEEAERVEMPLLDARSTAQYRARLESLEGELDEAERFGDPHRRDRLQAELDALTHELARATGLFGRARTTSGPAERARVAASKAITRALAAIARVHPDLADHLTRSLSTGARCVYRGELSNPVEWRVVPRVTK